jgi:hypothetical protein
MLLGGADSNIPHRNRIRHCVGTALAKALIGSDIGIRGKATAKVEVNDNHSVLSKFRSRQTQLGVVILPPRVEFTPACPALIHY